MYDKILNQLERNQKLIVIIFFTLFFITSLSVLKDYGLSWDEVFQWRENGEIVYNYVVHNDRKSLLDGNEKYHGPAFELILIFIQKALHLTDTRDVYLMRHVVTFLTFFTGVVFFYFLCKRSFKSWKIALTGCIFLILSPRIFADSFYNSKDPIFLVLFIIGMYTLLIYHERPTYKNAILYALACAFTIDTRILGIILPLISFGVIAIEFIHNTITNTKDRIHYGSLITFTVLLVSFTILFWPVLWKDTLFHFTAALSEMSKYHWRGSLLYQGKYLKATELPWHYLPVWIGISTPVAYLLLFPVGLFFIIKQFCAEPMNFIIEKKEQLLVLIVFFLPLIMVIVLKSVVYDGWRHVFFIYPAFILIVLYGLHYIYKLANSKGVFVFFLTLIIIGFNLGLLIYLHPYQNVYFNFLAGKDMKTVKQNFELDYYGVSSKQALEYILKNDPSVKLNIYAEQYPQQLNAQYLPIEQRNRIKFSELEYADYFISQYRFHRQPYDFENEVFSVMVGNASIMSVFKLSDSEKRSIGPQGKIWKKFSTDFEKQLPGSYKHIFKPSTGAHSGERADMTNVIHPFSDALRFEIPDSLCNTEGLVLKISLWKYEDLGSESNLIVDVKNKDSANVYFWNGINSKPLPGTIKRWDQFFATVQLPVIKTPLDIISIYLWNVGKTPIMIDDIEAQVIEKQGKQFQIDYLK